MSSSISCMSYISPTVMPSSELYSKRNCSVPSFFGCRYDWQPLLFSARLYWFNVNNLLPFSFGEVMCFQASRIPWCSLGCITNWLRSIWLFRILIWPKCPLSIHIKLEKFVKLPLDMWYNHPKGFCPWQSLLAKLALCFSTLCLTICC